MPSAYPPSPLFPTATTESSSRRVRQGWSTPSIERTRTPCGRFLSVVKPRIAAAVLDSYFDRRCRGRTSS